MSLKHYRGNIDAPRAALRIRSAQSAVILTHAKPDGDAVGSCVALARLCSQLGSKAAIWFAGPFPQWLNQVSDGCNVLRIAPDTALPALEPDLVIVADTGSWVQVEPLAAWLRHRSAKSLLIDHHLSGDEDIAAQRLIDPSAAATAEVIAGICDHALGQPSSQPLPRNISEPLYLGLATDTGWFKFSNVTPATLRLAARLLAGGVDAPHLYELVEQQDRPGRLGLLGRAIATHQMVPLPAASGGGSACVMTLRQSDFKQCDAVGEDTGGFSQHALAIADVRVSIIISEQAPSKDGQPVSKASLRSKPGQHAVDVAAVCASLGGGGHARAAGVKLSLSIDHARAAVLKALGIPA